MTLADRIPDAIDRVDVPRLLSPTSVARALDCPLSAVLATIRSLPRLPPDPKAVIGTICHKLIERAAKGQCSITGEPRTDLKAEFAKLVTEAEQALTADASLAHYVPLRATISLGDWLERRSGAIENALRQLRRRTSTEPNIVRDPSLAGAERKLESEALRLSGRADLIEETRETIVIRDFKSGIVHERDGTMSEAIQLQLRLYGLLVREQRPDKRVRLFVEHRETEEVSFDDRAAAAASETLGRLLGGLPVGERTPARPMARIGEHCRWCDVRHLCGAYRDAMPNQWSTPRTDYSLALDVWGTVAAVQRDGSTLSVAMRDDAGRHVSIVALDERHRTIDPDARDGRLWFFGLESRGDLRNAMNEYLHPTNFRELRFGSGERRAYRLRVFAE